MKKTILLLIAFCGSTLVFSQSNIGIGNTNPQQKLHVSGNIRVDSLAGSNGVVQYNSSGDLGRLPFSGNSSQVLLGDGSWGNSPGGLPAGTIVLSETYDNTSLRNQGYSLFGVLPTFTDYILDSNIAPANTWAPTYYKGNPLKYSPPFFDNYQLYAAEDTVMYVFSDNSFYAYNPLTDSWRFMFYNSSTSYRASYGAQSLWTGSEILVFGGLYSSTTNNGFRYNPATDSWTAISSVNQPSARRNFIMYVVGQKLVVWGGVDASDNVLTNGAVLDLVTNTWTAMSTVNAPIASKNFSSVKTTQNTIIVWGGSTPPSGYSSSGAVYNVPSNTWTTMSSTNAPAARAFHTAVWNDVTNEMIIFRGENFSSASGMIMPLNSSAVYNPTTNTWTTISTGSAPYYSHHAAFWTGTKMLVAGGTTLKFGAIDNTQRYSHIYDPSTNTWTLTTSLSNGKYEPSLMRVKNIIILFGGGTAVTDANGNQTSSAGYPQGERFFLFSTNTTRTLIRNRKEIYLYIKN